MNDTQTTNAGGTPATQPVIPDSKARELLREAVDTVSEVIRKVRGAITRVDDKHANAVHAHQIAAQEHRYRVMGVRQDERTMIRAHPLYPLQRLLMQATKQLADLLAITNPTLFANQKAQLNAELKRLEAQKLQEKANKVAA